MPRLALGIVSIAVMCVACGPRGPSEDLIFLDGRGVAASGDTLLAVTRPDGTGVIVIDRASGEVGRHASDALASPQHVQELGGRWYVSDIRDGRPAIAVFDANWQLESRLSLEQQVAVPHQFAVLPDNRIIVEAPDGRLVSLDGDSIGTFALVEQSTRTGFLVGALGGVLHAVPDRAITLYNALGKVRWRLNWPWQPTAYVTDLAVDARGRIHLLAGQGAERPTFVAFTLSSITGEVIRWSVPGTRATLSVDRVGNIEADSPERWLELQ